MDKVIGKAKIVETPIIDEKILRYAVHLRLPKDIAVKELECLLDRLDLEVNYNFRFVDVRKFNWKDGRDDVLWKVISEEDGREPPIHKYIIYLKSKERVNKDELVLQLADLLEDLNIEQIHLYMNVKTIKRFPYEKPRVVKTIPITVGMLTKATGMLVSNK